MDERIIKIQHVLKKELDDNRYQHTLGCDVYGRFDGYAL